MARTHAHAGTHSRSHARTQPLHGDGFTLVEVLVAIAIMALMALMTWRGLDAMWRTQASLQQRADQVRTLQSGLAQWQTDLNRRSGLRGIPDWDWDGKVLRITRDGVNPSEGVRVVAWTWRQDASRPGGGDWLRWQSGALTNRAEWQLAWQNARTWSQTPTTELRATEVSVHPLAGWQIFVHRGGSWVNPLSSDATISTPATGTTGAGTSAISAGGTPDAVRLVLDLPAGWPISGRITQDWVRPTLSGSAS